MSPIEPIWECTSNSIYFQYPIMDKETNSLLNTSLSSIFFTKSPSQAGSNFMFSDKESGGKRVALFANFGCVPITTLYVKLCLLRFCFNYPPYLKPYNQLEDICCYAGQLLAPEQFYLVLQH